jgi:hypothetical protein
MSKAMSMTLQTQEGATKSTALVKPSLELELTLEMPRKAQVIVNSRGRRAA